MKSLSKPRKNKFLNPNSPKIYVTRASISWKPKWKRWNVLRLHKLSISHRYQPSSMPNSQNMFKWENTSRYTQPSHKTFVVLHYIKKSEKFYNLKKKVNWTGKNINWYQQMPILCIKLKNTNTWISIIQKIKSKLK